MKVWLTIAAVSICVIFLQPVWDTNFTLDVKNPTRDKYSSFLEADTNFTLDVKNPTLDKYSSFLEALRGKAKDQNGLAYGGIGLCAIPVMADAKGYFRIDLVGTKGTIGVAVQKSDLYVMAYLTKNQEKKFQVRRFKDQISNDDIHKVFPEAKGVTPADIKYKENYASIVKVANITRLKLGLGFKKLNDSIGKVYETAYSERDEARFLLLAIQMISEAARFRYIEQQVLKCSDTPPHCHVLVLEQNWKRISQAIKCCSQQGLFPGPFEWDATEGKHRYIWKNVTEVSDLGAALLKNLEKKVEFYSSDEYMGSCDETCDGDHRADI